jgi:hypothetical protein
VGDWHLELGVSTVLYGPAEGCLEAGTIRGDDAAPGAVTGIPFCLQPRYVLLVRLGLTAATTTTGVTTGASVPGGLSLVQSRVPLQQQGQQGHGSGCRQLQRRCPRQARRHGNVVPVFVPVPVLVLVVWAAQR